MNKKIRIRVAYGKKQILITKRQMRILDTMVRDTTNRVITSYDEGDNLIVETEDGNNWLITLKGEIYVDAERFFKSIRK